MALWTLNSETRAQLHLPSDLTSQEVFALAGPPDHAGRWEAEDRSERGEFWDYYQPGRRAVRLLWDPENTGNKIRHLSKRELWPHWVDLRASLLVNGWMADNLGPAVYQQCPADPPQTESPAPVVVEPDEVQSLEIYSYRHNMFPIPTEKLALTKPYDKQEEVHRLLLALQSPPLPEASPAQFGRSRPLLKVEFSYCSDDDNPSFLVRLHLSSGSTLQLHTDSYYSHMLPWRLRLDEGEIVETYNLDISRAVAALLPEGFLDRVRLLESDRFMGRYLSAQLPVEERLSSYQPKPKPTDPNELDEDGKTALMQAARHNQRFLDLLDSGADLEARGQQGLTGLQMACLWESPEVVNRWLRCGAHLETLSLSGQTALRLSRERPSMLKILLEHGAQVNAADEDGDTALDQAIYSQNAKSIQVLLAAGATSTRARQNALGCLAKAELELERLHAYQNFYTRPEQLEAEARRQAFLEEMQVSYPDHDWGENPYERALATAKQILALLDANCGTPPHAG